MNKKLSLILLIVASVLFGATSIKSVEGAVSKPIKVGILHSLTGTMAISEKAVVDSTLFAIDEINRNGGLLGREIKPIVADGKSDLKTFAIEAKRLILDEKVSVVFGCWTSASRKIVKPIFENYDHLLFYPVQYEGNEISSNIVYIGATPNQQIIPAIKWCLGKFGKRLFLVGSDYIFPRIANAIIRDYVIANGGEIVGEEYILLGSKAVNRMVVKIVSSHPDVIINTINGDSNIFFFKELFEKGIKPDITPTMSFSIGENTIRSFDLKNMAGNYACWNYFQSIKTDINKKFVEGLKKMHGNERVISDPMEAAYIGVNLWAKSVVSADTDNVRLVRQYLKRQSFNAPEGVVHFNPENNHLVKNVRIGRIRDDGQFDIVWRSKKIVRPMPYIPYRRKEEWDKITMDFYYKWGKKWSATE